jgi:hypothetical protein
MIVVPQNERWLMSLIFIVIATALTAYVSYKANEFIKEKKL